MSFIQIIGFWPLIVVVLAHLMTGGLAQDDLSVADRNSYIHCANLLESVITSGTLNNLTGKANVVQLPPNLPDTTEVETELTVIQMHEISNEYQTFSVTAMITFTWEDERIAVHDEVCRNSSARFTILTTRALRWFPQWTIANGHGTILLKDSWQFNPAIAYTSGIIVWKVAFYFLTECPLNTQLFPFDIQECSINITLPHYGLDNLRFVAASTHPMTAESEVSLKSPVWQIVGGHAASFSSQFPSMSFRFLVQRRAGFYTVSLVLPNIVVNIMMAYTFLLPAFQEEKTSTCGAALVCYFFIELLFYDFSPRSSDNIAVLVIFFSFHILLALIAYVVECRLIRFAEKVEEMEKEKEKEEEKEGKKVNGDVAIEEADSKGTKSAKQREKADLDEDAPGPFDGMSPEYINDWCLVIYVIVVVLSYIIVFIYLPMKALAMKNSLMSSSYSAIPVEAK